MSDEFGNLAQIAANYLVSAMVTDSSEVVKSRFATVARRDRQLEATRRELTARSGSDLERAKSEQTQAWADSLQDLLEEDPGKAQALRDFLAYLATLRLTPDPAPAPTPPLQYADRGSSTAGRDNFHIDGDYVGRDKITKETKKKTNIFLPPVAFNHVVQQVTAHWIVSTITVVVAIGGTSAGLALAHKGANTPASSPTVATSTPAVAPSQQASVDWGALQGGPARTGAQSDETRIGTGNVSKLSPVRTYKTNFGSTAPLIANGILYVATNQLYAFDATGATNCSAAPATCTPLWTASAANIHGMAVANGDVFITDGEGVQAFSAAGSENCSGTPKVCAPLWATSTNNSTGPAFTPGLGSPVVANGVLYVPGYGDGIAPSLGGAYVTAFSAAGTTGCSGTPTICVPMWTTTGLPASSANDGSPAIADGVLYIANGATLDAFDATGSAGCSGTPKVCAPLWTGAMSGNETSTAPPAVADGIVYVDNALSGLYAFDATGTKNCSASATGKTCAPLWNAPSVPDGSALAVANGVVYDTGSGKLAAFDATAPTNCPGTGTVQTCTRAPLWTSAALTSGYLTSSPTVANGVVYVSSSGGGMYAYDAAGSLDCSVSGTAKACSPLWAAAGPGVTGGGSPAVVNGVLFVNVTGNGTIYAYSL
jgi:PQQ-like domain